ncbi:GNAT family N-acetyltransferase [Tenacibaculum sp. MEBiC06402]|uniref:GNAT family N-acetyltransferase n=1 Tax=unclassified Tenacibaculum TaxID=2635139 RepID=UPI003B9AAC38
MIFETERLVIRRLLMSDLNSFFELESNPNVLQYATGEVKTLSECEKELSELIKKYDSDQNDFWIYAVEMKLNREFIGTLALVKDDAGDDEIGYRFIERFWGNNYASELCKGLIVYCKQIGMKKLIGNVVNENVASEKILLKYGFMKVKEFVSDDIGLPETKYQLIL